MVFVTADRVYPVAFCLQSIASDIYLISQCTYFVHSAF